MKGLLIKDLRLLLKNKRFFGILVFVSLFLFVAQGAEGAAFIISYITIMGASLALSTISTDEFDGSTTFLMALPIQKKTYAVEKYVFSFLCSTACWAVATTVSCILMGSGAKGLIIAALILLAVFLLFQMLMIPVQLKFGGEKGRMVLMAIFVIVFVFVFAVEKFTESRFSTAEEAALWMENLYGWVMDLNPMGIVIGVISFLVISCCISMVISIRIMEKREY